MQENYSESYNMHMKNRMCSMPFFLPHWILEVSSLCMNAYVCCIYIYWFIRLEQSVEPRYIWLVRIQRLVMSHIHTSHAHRMIQHSRTFQCSLTTNIVIAYASVHVFFPVLHSLNSATTKRYPIHNKHRTEHSQLTQSNRECGPLWECARAVRSSSIHIYMGI